MISCADAVRQLWEYLDGLTTPEDRAKVEEHLSFCRRCCGEAEFADELRRFLSSQNRDEVPPEVLGRLTSIVEELDG